MSNIILIPARMASTRLPGKPMADIAGKPMIAQVVARALEADCGRVAVATDTAEIADAAREAGAEAFVTKGEHESGSDRIFEALQALDPDGAVETVINLQGDLPTIPAADIRTCLAPLADDEVDIATLGVEITDRNEIENPNVVKIIGSRVGQDRLRALYFTRAAAPWGEGPAYHHVGIYAYRRPALERFVALKPSPLEMREKLEQLRALEAGMRIDVSIVNSLPLGVDTPDDLERARQILSGRS